MKKTLLLMLAVLVGAFLTGCASGSGDPATENKTATQEKTENAEDGGKPPAPGGGMPEPAKGPSIND